MSEEKPDHIGETTSYIARWNYPEEHNHPSAGIINPRQQLILSGLKTLSSVAKEVSIILDRMDKPVRNIDGSLIYEEVGKEYKYKWTDKNPIERQEFSKLEPKIQSPEETRSLVDSSIMEHISEYCDWLTDYSVAIGGVGRLGANKGLNRIKGFTDSEQDAGDKERGRIAKFFLGSKKTEFEKGL